jgi:flagellar biogenesis protein FliO
VNTVAVIGRMLLALVLVLGVMWGLARWARKPLGGKADRVMAVLARQQLSRSSSVTVLRVMDRALVLGVTEQGIRLITETDLLAIEDALASESPSRRAWSRADAGELIRAGGTAVDSAATDSAATEGLGTEGSVAIGLATEDGPGGTEWSGSAAAGQLLTGPGSAGQRRVRQHRSLEGSVLSAGTWRQVLNAARELTVRR